MNNMLSVYRKELTSIWRSVKDLEEEMSFQSTYKNEQGSENWEGVRYLTEHTD